MAPASRSGTAAHFIRWGMTIAVPQSTAGAALPSACAASSKTLREGNEPIAGEWKGVLVKGDTRTVTEIEFAGREPRVTFWGSETMPIPPESVGRPLTVVANGRGIHFEVPRAGTF